MLEYKIEGASLAQPAQLLPVDAEYDVVVAGGGMAGVGAAIAAARAGCKTLLAEQACALGGLATLGLVNIPLDFVSGIGAAMFKELRESQGLWHRNTDPEKHKLALDRMVKKAGVTVLLAAQAVDTVVRSRQVCGLALQCKQGRRVVLAKRVIDCSGDAIPRFTPAAR